MLMQHIGLRVRGFYKIARLSDKWEAMMGTNSQQKPEAPTFRNNHGLNAPTGCFQGRSLDAVSLAQSSPRRRVE